MDAGAIRALSATPLLAIIPEVLWGKGKKLSKNRIFLLLLIKNRINILFIARRSGVTVNRAPRSSALVDGA